LEAGAKGLADFFYFFKYFTFLYRMLILKQKAEVESSSFCFSKKYQLKKQLFMEGISFLHNARGKKIAVQIDLQHHADIWEEFYTEWVLNKWWSGLDKYWREIFKEALKIEEAPGKEQLYQISHLNFLICKEPQITSLAPLEILSKLETLVVADTKITQIDEVYALRYLSHFDFINTKVSSLEPLREMKNLHEIYFHGTKVQSIEPLSNLSNLHTLALEKPT